MFQKATTWIKSIFTLNRSEQRAILFSLIIILLLFIINLLLPHIITSEPTDFDHFKTEIEQFRKSQQEIADSIRIEQLQNSGDLDEAMAEQKLHPFPFNPNKLPEEAWLQLGLSAKQIKTIKNYEAKGGKFFRKEDLKKIYSISEAEYNVLEPYIRIPSDYKVITTPASASKKPVKQKTYKKETRYLSLEINSADSAAFVNSLRIAPWIATRIIKYRRILGGFYKAGQLREVYGLDTINYNKIEKYLNVDTSLIIKLNINELDFKELLKHPYISYDITKEIMNYRTSRGLFKSTKQLMELDILTESMYIKIEPYLTVNQ